jgi:sugar lactone lactonase YvrE
MPYFEVLMSGVAFGESPRWGHDKRLWFADWGAGEIVAVDLDGNSEVILSVDFPSFPMCFDWMPDGRLLLVSSRDGRLLRREHDGSVVTHADLSGLAGRGHPWNEIVVDGRGNTYINSVGFDLMGGEDPKPGFIAVITPDGDARQVAGGLAFPNGMVVTPDDSTLIVAESYEGRLTAFDIDADGGLSNRRVWADLGEGGDGICMDADGAIWTPKFEACVRVAEGGEVLETIELDRFCFACMLGGEDGRTLFLNVAEWNGPEGIFNEPRTGQVLAYDAPAPHAGRP